MLKKIRHIGVIVENFDRTTQKFKDFGLTCTEILENKEEGIKFSFFSIGDTLIEFLSFSPDKGWDPFHTLVRSQNNGINHFCLEVDDLEAAIKHFEKNGAKLAPGSPRPGAHGRVAFFTPETTDEVLIE